MNCIFRDFTQGIKIMLPTILMLIFLNSTVEFFEVAKSAMVSLMHIESELKMMMKMTMTIGMKVMMTMMMNIIITI